METVKGFVCECGKSFRDKTDYTRHVNKKKSCIIKIVNKTNFYCVKCDNYYSSVSNLNKHLKKCNATSRPQQSIDLGQNIDLDQNDDLDQNKFGQNADLDQNDDLDKNKFGQNANLDQNHKHIQDQNTNLDKNIEPKQINNKPIQMEYGFNLLDNFYLEDAIISMHSRDYKWYINAKIINI
jgi:hypothetical protein